MFAEQIIVEVEEGCEQKENCEEETDGELQHSLAPCSLFCMEDWSI